MRKQKLRNDRLHNIFLIDIFPQKMYAFLPKQYVELIKKQNKHILYEN